MVKTFLYGYVAVIVRKGPDKIGNIQEPEDKNPEHHINIHTDSAIRLVNTNLTMSSRCNSPQVL